MPISADMYSTSTENVFANKHRCKPPESAWKAEAWALQEIEPTPLLPPPPAPMSVIHAGVGGGMWQHQIEKHEGDFAALLARQGSSLWTLHTGPIGIKVFRIQQVLAYKSFEVFIHMSQHQNKAMFNISINPCGSTLASLGLGINPCMLTATSNTY